MIKFLHPNAAAVIACVLTVTYLDYTTAHKNHNINEYLLENKRTRFTKQNYVMDRGNFDSGLDNAMQMYGGEGSRKEDDLPALIVDYANMIRNDILLLDNSVETRTRKRGNINFDKPNQAISDPPCSCEVNSTSIVLGNDSYPEIIETKVCDDSMCPAMYACRSTLYNLTVLKRRIHQNESSDVVLPLVLKHHWVARNKLITVGCTCLRDYVKPN